MPSALCPVQASLHSRVSENMISFLFVSAIAHDTYLSRHFERVNLVKGNDCDAFLQLAVLEQLLADLLVLNDNIV